MLILKKEDKIFVLSYGISLKNLISNILDTDI